MNTDLFGNEVITKLSLSDKYIQPPFSILNSQKRDWQARKHKWISMGINSEIGRGKNMIGLQAFNESDKYITSDKHNGTSVFDPVLCELMYRWFCPDNGLIIDPFAGGSVRGIVANYLGYNYTGIELRQEQVDSNMEQGLNILAINNQPQWYVGDSECVLIDLIPNYDFIFSCPPYFNLEVYSDLPEDLSNMQFDQFEKKYNSIIRKTCDKLKNKRFAVFVVGDVRDKKGYYIDFIGLTKKCFFNAGLKLYNELIYIEMSYFSAGMRADRYMSSNKKIPKVHQNVLVFYKE